VAESAAALVVAESQILVWEEFREAMKKVLSTWSGWGTSDLCWGYR